MLYYYYYTIEVPIAFSSLSVGVTGNEAEKLEIDEGEIKTKDIVVGREILSTSIASVLLGLCFTFLGIRGLFNTSSILGLSSNLDCPGYAYLP